MGRDDKCRVSFFSLKMRIDSIIMPQICRKKEKKTPILLRIKRELPVNEMAQDRAKRSLFTKPLLLSSRSKANPGRCSASESTCSRRAYKIQQTWVSPTGLGKLLKNSWVTRAKRGRKRRRWICWEGRSGNESQEIAAKTEFRETIACSRKGDESVAVTSVGKIFSVNFKRI